MGRLGAPGVALLMALENVFPPLPSELIMPYAGYLAGRGELSFVAVALAGWVGSLAGTLILYAVGRAWGRARLYRFIERHGHWLTLDTGDLDRASAFFHRHGGATVFLCRLVPALRSLISIPAGIERMPLLRFTLFTALGTALWATALGAAGFALAEAHGEIDRWVNVVANAVLATALAIYLVRLARRLPRRRSPRPG
jgi:membrane protein DedA with SNARE-associated domain